MKSYPRLFAVVMCMFAILAVGADRHRNSIRVEGECVTISHRWPSEDHQYGGLQQIFFAPTPTGAWQMVSESWFDRGDEESEYSQSISESPSRGFFKIVDLPSSPDPWNVDSDEDGLVDAYEEMFGSDPYNPDSDFDGLMDFEEDNWGTDPLNPDTDGDGINDAEEIYLCWNPLNSDSDGDGLLDGEEYYMFMSDGMNPDSDYDGMDDKWEVDYDFNPNDELDADFDADGDGLTNLEEYRLGTNPRNFDTDGDNMDDGVEVQVGRNPLNPDDESGDRDRDGLSDQEESMFGTDPDNPDSDDDGLTDGLEVSLWTNPLNPDSDNDGLTDFEELLHCLDPLSPDSDNDAIDDYWEVEMGLNPLDASDAGKDTDGDGLDNSMEYMLGTCPTKKDTDDDGADDGWEVRYYFDPLNRSDGWDDSDEDGLLNRDEFKFGTNPRNPDTDGDGLDDGQEIEFGSNPKSSYSLSAKYDDLIMYHSGRRDPVATDEKSGLTNWQVAFYGTDEDGNVRLPTSSGSNAVLVVSVRGSGYGELTVGEKTVSLFGDGRAEAHNELRLNVARGVRHGIVLAAPESLSVSLDSGDYAIGELPSALREDPAPVQAASRLKSGTKIALRGWQDAGSQSGWIVFPRTKATSACIHDLTTRIKRVTLDPGPDVEGLVCSWDGNDSVNVDNRPPLSAELKGTFPIKEIRKVGYHLSHILHLFGEATLSQIVRFCPQNDDEDEEDEERTDGGSDGGWTSTETCWCSGRYCEDPACTCLCHGPRPPEEMTGEDEENICPEHGLNFELCEPLHREAYDEAMKLGERQEVLKLHDPAEGAMIDILVPEAITNCCDCPEHTGRKVFLATSSERLSVEDLSTGTAFSSTEEDTCVTVFGIAPSKKIGDSKLAFAAGGKILEHHAYTVLGVGIESETEYLVCEDATPIRLVTDVGLRDGNVRLAFRDAKGSFRLVFDDDRGRMIVLLDSQKKPSLDMDIRQWRKLMNGDEAGFESDVRIMTDEAGSVTLEFGFVAEKDNQAVKDVATKNFRTRSPRFVFDYDRDGVIGEKDVAAARAGRVFRFWINDDGDDKGERTSSGFNYEDDTPGKDSGANARDERVNGLRDLVDFTPVWIDISEILEDGKTAGDLKSLEWRLRSDCVNAVWTKLPRSEAGSFQRKDKGKLFGTGLQEEITSATVVPLAEGVPLKGAFAEGLFGGKEGGVFLIEGVSPGSELVLEGYRMVNSKPAVKVFSGSAKLEVNDVEKMYRWMSLRKSFEGKYGLDGERVFESPAHRPDSECGGTHIVFVHGFNVNFEEARAIGAEMFKRLWQSGHNGAYTVADWFGDEGQFNSLAMRGIFGGTVSPNYYANVEHAFMSASAFASACSRLPGKKVVIAHSLGNVLVSAAIVDYGLSYKHYFMLNAAVATEAYVGNDETPEIHASMRDPAWTNAALSCWSCEWHKFFRPPDIRATLTWRNRFGRIKNASNLYSAGDLIVGNATDDNADALDGSTWRAQELLKGANHWIALNLISVGKPNISIEGGWGIGDGWKKDAKGPDGKVVQTRDEAITAPLFTPFETEAERMKSLSPFTIDDPEAARKLQSKLLGDAIPATTRAAGANTVDGMDGYDLGTFLNGSGGWNHSDVKQRSYFEVYPLFDKIVEKGGSGE